MNAFLLSMERLHGFISFQCHLTLANGITKAVFEALCCIFSAIVTEQATKAGRKKCKHRASSPLHRLSCKSHISARIRYINLLVAAVACKAAGLHNFALLAGIKTGGEYVCLYESVRSGVMYAEI